MEQIPEVKQKAGKRESFPADKPEEMQAINCQYQETEAWQQKEFKWERFHLKTQNKIKTSFAIR